VPGLEVSTRAAGRTHHVLGFFVRADDERLVSLLDTMSAERLDRARRMVDRLCELGYELTFEEVEQIAGRGVVARPHVARALVARGHVGSVKDAFNTLLADGGPADVRRRVPTPEEGVHLIRDAGGAAVLAHPAVAAHDGDARAVREAFVEGLAGAGLAGLEVDHPDHDPGVREELRRLAADLDLVATGGSDFHGGDPEWLGVCLTHPAALEALEARATA
jgi:predicted metal-dependent phosphoesterase TrpH